MRIMFAVWVIITDNWTCQFITRCLDQLKSLAQKSIKIVIYVSIGSGEMKKCVCCHKIEWHCIYEKR